MYWDASKHTYLPAPTNAATQEGQDDDKANPEKKDKKDKVKVAKKIAKVFFFHSFVAFKNLPLIFENFNTRLEKVVVYNVCTYCV